MNTKWTGIVNIPDPTAGRLEFTKDSMVVTFYRNVKEYMTCRVTGGTLLIKVVSGTSPMQ